MKNLPDLVPDAKLKLPKEAERTLPSGLTVIAIRRPAVPLVELRLRVPFGRASLPRATLLSQALFTGTGTMSSVRSWPGRTPRTCSGSGVCTA
jgi:predicted Zn-dependent peptidase